LVEVIVAGIDTFPENIVLFAAKELEEGEQYGVLPVEDSG
jgi:hypothetical protein